MNPMVRASGLHGIEQLLRELGVAPEPLLTRYQIDPQTLRNHEALLPLRQVTQLIEAGAEASGCTDFGLRLAGYQDINVLGPIAIAVQHAPTLASAIDLLARYLFILSTGMRISLHDPSAMVDGAVELRFTLSVPSQAMSRQAFDLCLGDVHRIAALLTGHHYRLLGVSLPHTPLAPTSTYARFFGAPIYTAQTHGGLHLARESITAQLPLNNQALRQLAEDYLNRNFDNPIDTLSERVRQAIHRSLGNGPVSKDQIARLLGLHPRTLQRRLAAEETHFEALREAVFKEVTLRYLCQTNLPLTQLASLLGLSEQSALTRCCKRWFGRTPSAIRRVTDAPNTAHGDAP